LFVAFDLPDLALANLVILALIQITVPVLAKLASLAITATWNYWTSHRFVCRTFTIGDATAFAPGRTPTAHKAGCDRSTVIRRGKEPPE
jgi:hypothetical protein